MLVTSKSHAGEFADICDSVCNKIREIAMESPFVVKVSSERGVHSDGISLKKGAGIGSGIVILLEGGTIGILTNNHVIDNPLASRIWVSFDRQGFMQPVTIIGRDPAADLALLSAPALPPNVRPAILAKHLELGQQVYTLGYPFGVRRTSVGYVNTKESHTWLYAWTQAPINPGDSGGPAFNAKHEVVGINTAIIPGATTTFVLPIEHVHKILPRLMREGVVRHAGAGFVFGDASRMLPTFFEQLGLTYPPEEDWVIVFYVEPGSSAAHAGIAKGDIIIQFNGTLVKNARDLDMKTFFDHHPGESVIFTTKRGTQEFERRVILTNYGSVERED